MQKNKTTRAQAGRCSWTVEVLPQKNPFTAMFRAMFSPEQSSF